MLENSWITNPCNYINYIDNELKREKNWMTQNSLGRTCHLQLWQQAHQRIGNAFEDKLT